MNKQSGIFESNDRQNFMITSSEILAKLSYPSNSNIRNSTTHRSSVSSNYSKPYSKYSLSEVEIHESSRTDRFSLPCQNNYPSEFYPRNLRSTKRTIKQPPIINNIDYSPLISIKDEIPQETISPRNQPPDYIPSYPSPKLGIKTSSITYIGHDGYTESHNFDSDRFSPKKSTEINNLGNAKYGGVENQSELAKSMFGDLDTFSILYPDQGDPRTRRLNSADIRNDSSDKGEDIITSQESKITSPSISPFVSDFTMGEKRSNLTDYTNLLDIVLNPINQILPCSFDQPEDRNLKITKNQTKSPVHRLKSNTLTNITPKIKIIDLKLEERKHQSRMLNVIIQIVSEGRSENHIQQLILERFNLGDIKLAQEIYQSKFKRIPISPTERQYQLISSGRASSIRSNIVRYSRASQEGQYLRSDTLDSRTPEGINLSKSPKPKFIINNIATKILPLMSGLIPMTVIDPTDDIVKNGIPELVSDSKVSPDLKDGVLDSAIFEGCEEGIYFQDDCPFSPSYDELNSPIPYQGTLSPRMSVLSPILDEQPFIHDHLFVSSPTGYSEKQEAISNYFFEINNLLSAEHNIVVSDNGRGYPQVTLPSRSGGVLLFKPQLPQELKPGFKESITLPSAGYDRVISDNGRHFSREMLPSSNTPKISKPAFVSTTFSTSNPSSTIIVPMPGRIIKTESFIPTIITAQPKKVIKTEPFIPTIITVQPKKVVKIEPFIPTIITVQPKKVIKIEPFIPTIITVAPRNSSNSRARHHGVMVQPKSVIPIIKSLSENMPLPVKLININKN